MQHLHQKACECMLWVQSVSTDVPYSKFAIREGASLQCQAMHSGWLMLYAFFMHMNEWLDWQFFCLHSFKQRLTSFLTVTECEPLHELYVVKAVFGLHFSFHLHSELNLYTGHCQAMQQHENKLMMCLWFMHNLCSENIPALCANNQSIIFPPDFPALTVIMKVVKWSLHSHVMH